MKRLAFALAIMVAASPALAQRHRVVAGGDPDLDLAVRPRDHVRVVQPAPDDHVYLPGLTEPADMRKYKGVGGPIEENASRSCSATVRDRCTRRGNRAR